MNIKGILGQTERELMVIKPGREQPTMEQSSEIVPRCSLCQEPTRSKYCGDCSTAIIAATSYRAENCVIPKRYAEAKHIPPHIDTGKSYLFHGDAGTGKTYASYSLIRQMIHNDPRKLIAAYSWTTVLMQLRRGYSDRDDQSGNLMIDALRKADMVLLDDLGAEKITDGNSGWLREILFVILNDRWAEMRDTIITSNLGPGALASYVGERIISRIIGMCEAVEFTGGDRRV